MSNKKVGSLPIGAISSSEDEYEEDDYSQPQLANPNGVNADKFHEDLVLMKCTIPIIKPNSGGKYYSNAGLHVNYVPEVSFSECETCYGFKITKHRKDLIKHKVTEDGVNTISISYTPDYTSDISALVKFKFNPSSYDLNWQVYTETMDNTNCIVIPSIAHPGFLSIKDRSNTGYRVNYGKIKPHKLEITVLRYGECIPLTVTNEYGIEYNDITTANLITY